MCADRDTDDDDDEVSAFVTLMKALGSMAGGKGR